MTAPASAPARGFRERFVAYKDLAKLEMFYPFLAVPLVWTLLESEVANDSTTLVIVVLAVVVVVGVRTAESALDDVAGIRDGIDTFNYEQPSSDRRRTRKPLLDNRLTEQQAINYARIALIASLASFVAAGIIVDFDPLWAPIAAVVAAFAVVAYSWGPKLSYIGAQELIAVLGVAAVVCVTYAYATGGLTWSAAIEGLLLGLWLDQTVVLANLHDLEGDRRAGRGTMAVRLAARPYQRYVIAVFALAWTLLLAAVILGELPWWLLLLQIPVVALQVRILVVGIRHDDPLSGWRLGRRTFPIAWMTLVVANLIAFHW
ncbi:MAG TPA: UbiA family prenyltransferase [Thermoleophilaceae bacterium]